MPLKEPERYEVNLQEGVFTSMFHAGGIRSIVLVFETDGRRCSIQYVNGGSKPGFVITKRNDVKLYRLETAMAFLHAIGVGSVTVELHNFDFEARQRRLVK